MIKLRKTICIMLSMFLLLTACGQEQASEGTSATDDTSTSETLETSNPTTQPEPGQQEKIVVANIRGTSSFFTDRVLNFGKEKACL